MGITARVPMIASGTIGRPAWIARRKLPALNLATRPSGAARALGVHDERQPVGDERAPSLQDARPIGIAAIDEQMAAALEMPAEHREPGQRFLRDDAQLVRQRAEHDRRVVVALMIRHEDVRGAGRQPRETFDRHFDTGRLENQPRPRTRAAVRKTSAMIDEARHDRSGAEHDGVDRDGRNQIEDGPPPVVRGDAQASRSFRAGAAAQATAGRGVRRPRAFPARPPAAPGQRCRLRCAGRRSSCPPSSAARW